jgi:hypothetical protein
MSISETGKMAGLYSAKMGEWLAPKMGGQKQEIM